MKPASTAAVAASCAVAAGVLLALNSCSTAPEAVADAPKISGAHYVGDQACLECHARIVREFPASPHARLHVVSAQRPGQSGCESCHGPGSEHIATGGSSRFIINPGKDPATCFQCHPGTRVRFSLPRHHPVLEGRMSCVQCHDPHGSDIFKPSGGLAMARQNQSCAQCHREQTRPFVFEHEAMREGCTVCHEPHGSVNEKMLIETDPNLCLRCHAQTQPPGAGGAVYIGAVDHSAFLSQGTCWTAGCHTAVHGSNVDPWLRY